MSNLEPIFRKIQKVGVTSALLIAVMLVDGNLPASAQFFGGPPQRQLPSNGGFGGSGWFGGDLFAPFQETPRPYLRRRQVPKRAQAPRPIFKPAAIDFSKAPLPEKRGVEAKQKILVLGDGMADWLAAGLEDAYADQPDTGVIREIKSGSGVLKYQPQGEPADWIVAGDRHGSGDFLASEPVNDHLGHFDVQQNASNTSDQPAGDLTGPMRAKYRLRP
jgi:hypothetical protein